MINNLKSQYWFVLKLILTIALVIILGKKLYFVIIREDLHIMLAVCAGIFLLFLSATKRLFLSLTITWAIVELIQKTSALQHEFTGEALSWESLHTYSMSDVFQTILQYPMLVGKITEYIAVCIALLLVSVYAEIKIKNPYIRISSFIVSIASLVFIYSESNKEKNLPHYGYGSIKYLIWSMGNENEDPYLVTTDEIKSQPLQISCPSTKRNILVVMEESTLNPYINKDFLEYAPKDHYVKHFFDGNLLASPMHVHVYGGGTLLSEFAFLTGIPHNSYKGFSTIVASDRKNGNDSFTLQAIAKQCGYKTLAVTPEFSTKIWKADKFHASIKTDTVFAFTKDELVGRWRDKSDYIIFDKIKKIIAQEKGDKPLLIYTLTTSQHGPFDSIEDYMSRLAASAKAFNNFGNSLDDEWVYGWFGDHQPHIDNYPPHGYTSDTHITFASFFTKDAKILPFKGFNKHKPIDIAFMSYLLTKNLGFGLDNLGLEYDKAIKECQSDFHQCSEKTKDDLYNAYLKYDVKPISQ